MIKFHPSSLGLLMTDAQSADRALVPAELLEICDKPRKTDKDREQLLPYKEASLSAGAKTYLNTLAKEHVYGYHQEVDTKYMDKGRVCEQQAIDLINYLRFKSYEKNTERRESEYLTGECDIYVPRVKTIDTKVAWSLATFPAVSEDAHDPIYEWQGRAYMKLWDVPEHEVVFAMLDTPEGMRRWEQAELHIVSHIPAELRLTSITYQRCPVLEAKMDAKCAVAMQYLLRRIELIHAERVPKTIITIGAKMELEPPAPKEQAVEAALADAMTTGTGVMQISPEGAKHIPAAEVFSAAPTLRLGQISERLLFTVTADFLLHLGFAPAATDKAAKLYHEADFPRICAALQRHIAAVQSKFTTPI